MSSNRNGVLKQKRITKVKLIEEKGLKEHATLFDFTKEPFYVFERCDVIALVLLLVVLFGGDGDRGRGAREATSPNSFARSS